MFKNKTRYTYILLFFGLITYILSSQVFTDAKTEKPLLIIMAGQSNMEGHVVTNQLPNKMQQIPLSVQIINNNQNSDKTFISKRNHPFLVNIYQSPLLNESLSHFIADKYSPKYRWGPEISVAHMAASKWPLRQIIIFKYAIGGSSLADWKPDWDSKYAEISKKSFLGPLFKQLTSNINNDLNINQVEVGAILWMQGERDSRFKRLAKDYTHNLKDLIYALRSFLNNPKTPFILGLINPPKSKYPFVDTVRKAQINAAKTIPNVYLVDTNDLPKCDSVHYDTTGCIILGTRFFNILEQIK